MIFVNKLCGNAPWYYHADFHNVIVLHFVLKAHAHLDSQPQKYREIKIALSLYLRDHQKIAMI